ncbi:MAG: hypothetical protein KGL39_30355 [Patescibacteria group bacterium]|nr:hypothetical protein [Patescibacteria group bacterium]
MNATVPVRIIVFICVGRAVGEVVWHYLDGIPWAAVRASISEDALVFGSLLLFAKRRT